MVNIRSKGAAGERELADWLYMHLPLREKPERNLDQVRSGGGDLLVPPFLFECKRHENLDLQSWWIQAKTAANKAELLPCVAFRQNKKKWEFLLPASMLDINLEVGYIRLESKVFVQYAKQFYCDS